MIILSPSSYILFTTTTTNTARISSAFSTVASSSCSLAIKSSVWRWRWRVLCASKVRGMAELVEEKKESTFVASGLDPEKRDPTFVDVRTEQGGIVALGKFDALHIGHRELAIQASKFGVPFLLSFFGMAEVLGWEPRAPIVAKCDRKRVLSTWAQYCGQSIPREFLVEFSKVRYLTPREFVEKLSKELGVRGVVAGKNYRFGYRAAGDASELVRLCEEYGMMAYIINSVMDKNQHSKNIDSGDSKEQGQVSSTRVRHALSKGDMEYVSELLGRQHRLMLAVKDQDEFISNKSRVAVPKSCVLNLPPREGLYENCYLVIGDGNVVPCRVIIDMTHIYVDLDAPASCTYITSQDLQCLGIDFGEPVA